MKLFENERLMNRGTVLVVDDTPENRHLLRVQLQRRGYEVLLAADGPAALELLAEQACDVVLLDIMMPEMSGYEVLEQIKADPKLASIPVLMIAAVNDMESVVRCLTLGADDYLHKPFNPIVLHARVRACVERKQLHDQEQRLRQMVEVERDTVQRLLHAILPAPIAEQLQQQPGLIAEHFAEATVLFTDLVGFTALAARVSPDTLLTILNTIFSAFDQLALTHGAEKIKTIGDAYMAVAGVPTPCSDHARVLAELALDMQTCMAQLREQIGESLHLRVGLHTGPVVAGVIGTQKFSYDLWGDTVNIASRMEAHGAADRIQVSAATYAQIADGYVWEQRDPIAVKGRGIMQTYWLNGRYS